MIEAAYGRPNKALCVTACIFDNDDNFAQDFRGQQKLGFNFLLWFHFFLSFGEGISAEVVRKDRQSKASARLTQRSLEPMNVLSWS